MSQPWEIYDALLDGLPGDVVVRAAGQGPRWSRVLNSAGVSARPGPWMSAAARLLRRARWRTARCAMSLPW